MTPITSWRLDDEYIAAIELIRERDGIPASEQMRRALKLWFAEKGVAFQGSAQRPRRRATDATKARARRPK